VLWKNLQASLGKEENLKNIISLTFFLFSTSAIRGKPKVTFIDNSLTSKLRKKVTLVDASVYRVNR
jgi:hypothetical protein